MVSPQIGDTQGGRAALPPPPSDATASGSLNKYFKLKNQQFLSISFSPPADTHS